MSECAKPLRPADYAMAYMADNNVFSRESHVCVQKPCTMYILVYQRVCVYICVERCIVQGSNGQ